MTVSVTGWLFQVQVCRSWSITSWPRSSEDSGEGAGLTPSLAAAPRLRTARTRSTKRRCEKGFRM